MAITDEVVRVLKEKHPDVELHVLTHPTLDVEVVVRGPTEPEWKAAKAMADDPERKIGTNGVLVNACVLYPDKAELAALIKAHPALVDVWSGEIAEIAGATKGIQRRKL